MTNEWMNKQASIFLVRKNLLLTQIHSTASAKIRIQTLSWIMIRALWNYFFILLHDQSVIIAKRNSQLKLSSTNDGSNSQKRVITHRQPRKQEQGKMLSWTNQKQNGAHGRRRIKEGKKILKRKTVKLVSKFVTSIIFCLHAVLWLFVEMTVWRSHSIHKAHTAALNDPKYLLLLLAAVK